MIKQINETLVGVKFPTELKRTLTAYCDRNGIKIKSFIAKAVREKLHEMAEDAHDNAVVNERLKNPTFISEQEMKAYLRKRKIID